MKDDFVYDLPSPFEREFKIGVAIHYDKKQDQMHCGIAFAEQDTQQIIHLATHNCLTLDTNLNGFQCIVKPSLPNIVQESFVALCLAIKDDINNGTSQVPYGFLYDDYAIIEKDGKLALTEKEIGLTCATYVLTFFHSCGFNLVDISNWPVRDEDKPWYEGIVNLFIKYKDRLGISSDHLSRLREQMNVPRFRPEEVAVSSALFDEGPAETQLIWDKGKKLREYMISIV